MRIGLCGPLVSARVSRLFSIFLMAWLNRSLCPCIRGFRVSILPNRRLLRVSKNGSSSGFLLFRPQQRFFQASSPTTSDVAVAATTAQENNGINAIKDSWKGASASYSSSSEHVTHVLVDNEHLMMKNNKQASPSPFTVLDAVQSVLDQQQQQPAKTTTTPISGGSSKNNTPPPLTARELIALGSVWFLPHPAPRDPAKGVKPKRLYSAQNETRVLQIGDYLRVHHFPRRFLQVHEYDWSRRINDDDDDDDETISDSSNDVMKKKPGLIVAENEEKGWLVIDKPHGVPVHMTVDNCRENVQDQVYRARKKKKKMAAGDIYVSTPHRLDQNTSGLFVVATSKLFAGYYAQLLRFKTALQLKDQQDDDDNNSNNVEVTEKAMIGSVHKVYRCLVCIIEPPVSLGWSVNSAVNDLMSFVTNNKTMRHFLEPSIRAPKRFLSEQPQTAAPGDDENEAENDKNAWLECLLRIRSVGKVCALVGNRVGIDLGRKLWSEQESMQEDETCAPIRQQPTRIPANCRAVVELEVELLTGRTHQIRGQLTASGFPLVGDTQYGGAIPIDATAPSTSHLQPERLALQCCELEFVDPDIYKQDDKDDTLVMRRSKRWNKFRLSSAWWTPLVQEYDEQIKTLSASEATANMFDVLEKASTTTLAQADDSNDKTAKSHLLPERIQLSPGKHKYVLIRAAHPKDENVHWFVKSAAPEECGGPYHGNVAQDLCEWITAAGYSPQVTGGGRIDYDPLTKTCIVSGFSYGFGKGDHAFAANLIRRIAGIPATHDDRDGIY